MTPAVVVQAPAGLGKTSLVHKAIAARSGGAVEIYAPTHALAEEQATKIRGANPNLTVKVVLGRSHKGADRKPMCKKHELAEEVASAGAEVYATLCAKNRGKPSEERCQHYDTCPYIAQFKSSDVTIYTHAHLPLQRSQLEAGVPEIAVIDESFFGSCIGTVEIPLASLCAELLGLVSARVCAEIEHAFTRFLPLHKHLYSVGITPDICGAALQEVRHAAPSTHPGMDLNDRRAALMRLREVTRLTELLNAVCAEYFVARRECHALKYCSVTQTITVYLKKSISRFHDRQGNEARVLAIDANANEQLIGQFFNVVTFTTIPADRQVEIFQCQSTRCSTTSLVPARNTNPKCKREASKRLKELERFIAQRAKQHPRLLVVGPQAITGNRRLKLRPLIKVPVNVALAHFGAIRGIDQWKDHDAIVVIGRHEPPIEGIEDIARCLFSTDRTPLELTQDWTTEQRGYRLKRGLSGVDVVRHPDARVQAILEQMREGETQQAIDRLRLVHARGPKRAYVLSNVVLDVDVDHLLTWDEMMNGGGRIERAWNALQGVMPLAPAWLAVQFPRLWNTAGAAKADAGGWLIEGRFTNINTLSNSALFKAQYRPTHAAARGARQRAWSWCLSVHAEPEVTREKLELLLGVAVEMRGTAIPAAMAQPGRRRSTVPRTTPVAPPA
jgi:hypothetical protein